VSLPTLNEQLSQDAVWIALETARTGAMVMAAPVLAGHAPARLRALLAVVLAFLVHGAMPAPSAIASMDKAILAAPGEVLIGAAMGLVVRMSVDVAQIAGEVMSPIIGFGAASLFDPHTQSPETVLTRALRLFAMFLAFVTGLHRVALSALFASFRLVPPGAATGLGRAAQPLMQIVTETFAGGIRMALPVLGILVLTQIALAFVSRAAPTMQVFSIGFAVSLVVGGGVLMVALPDITRDIVVEMSQAGRRMERVLSAVIATE